MQKLENYMFCRGCNKYNILERHKVESSQVHYIVYVFCTDCKYRDQCTIRKDFYNDWRIIKEGELKANSIPIPLNA